MKYAGPKGDFNQVHAGRNRIEIPSGLKVVFGTKKIPLSALAVAGFMKYAGPKAISTKYLQGGIVSRYLPV
jgi:hypothetical protein